MNTEKKKIVIIQLSRFGDLIQTYQAVRKVLQGTNEFEFVLLAREKFVTPLEFLMSEVFKNIIKIPSMDSFVDGDNFNFDNFKGIIDEFPHNEIYCSINLTFNKSSAILNTLISGEFKKGIYTDSKLGYTFNDLYSCYIHGLVQSGYYNKLNLVDLFTGVIWGRISGEQKNDIKSFEFKNTNSGKLFYAIHPFTSSQKKSWSLEKWGSLINLLCSKFNIDLMIFAGPENQADANHLFSNYINQEFHTKVRISNPNNSIQTNFEILKSCNGLICHDSMFSHLGALINLPTIVVSLGTVRPDETMPYNQNSVVIAPLMSCYPCFPQDKCADFACHETILLNEVEKLFEAIITACKFELQISNALKDYHPSSINIYYGSFKSGFFVTCSIKSSKSYLDSGFKISEFFRTCTRVAFLKLLEDIDFEDQQVNFNDSEIKKLKANNIALQYLKELYTNSLACISNILIHFEKDPNLQLHEPLFKLNDELRSFNKNTSIVAITYPSISPIINFTQLRMACDESYSFSEQIMISKAAYEDGLFLISIYQDLVESTISINRKNLNLMEK